MVDCMPLDASRRKDSQTLWQLVRSLPSVMPIVLLSSDDWFVESPLELKQGYFGHSRRLHRSHPPGQGMDDWANHVTTVGQ